MQNHDVEDGMGFSGLVPSREELAEQRRNRLTLRRKLSEALPLCPDHRDKVKGLSCRQCAVESLNKSIDKAIDELDPEMPRSAIVELRELLIRRRAEINKQR